MKLNIHGVESFLIQMNFSHTVNYQNTTSLTILTRRLSSLTSHWTIYTKIIHFQTLRHSSFALVHPTSKMTIATKVGMIKQTFLPNLHLTNYSSISKTLVAENVAMMLCLNWSTTNFGARSSRHANRKAIMTTLVIRQTFHVKILATFITMLEY